MAAKEAGKNENVEQRSLEENVEAIETVIGESSKTGTEVEDKDDKNFMESSSDVTSSRVDNSAEEKTLEQQAVESDKTDLDKEQFSSCSVETVNSEIKENVSNAITLKNYIAEKEHIIKEKQHAIEEREHTIEQKEHTIEKKEHTIEQKEHTVEQEKHTIEQKENVIGDKEQKIEQKVHEIEEKMHSVEQKEPKIEQKEQTVEQKEHTIEQKEHTVEQKEHTTEQKEHTVEQKEHTVEQKEHAVEQKEHTVEQKEHTMEQKEHTFEQKEHTVEQKEHTVEQKEHAIEQKEHAIEQKEHTVEQKEHTVEQKENTAEQKEHTVEQKEHTVEQKENTVEQKERIIEEKELTSEQEELTIEQKEEQIEERYFSNNMCSKTMIGESQSDSNSEISALQEDKSEESENVLVEDIANNKLETLKHDDAEVGKTETDHLSDYVLPPASGSNILQRDQGNVLENKIDKISDSKPSENPFHCIAAEESSQNQEFDDLELKELKDLESVESNFDNSSKEEKDILIEQSLIRTNTVLLASKTASEEDQESLDKEPRLRVEDSLPFISENSNSSLPERVMPTSVTDTLDISMDAYTESERSETPMFDTPGPATPASSIMDTWSVSAGPTPSKRSRQNSTGSSANVDTATDDPEQFPASKLFEYQWPPDTSGDYYMLQEQISEFLAVKSFKRKYPELQRRTVDMNERVFLREKGAVTETQCDLGLTAVKSEDVYDLMLRDYPDKYQEYAAVLHERERQSMKEKHKEYGAPKLEKSKMTEYIKKATRSAAEWNTMFLREKREDRRAYFDLQTFNIHYPKGKYKTLPQEMTAPSPYPVTLIPGQFQDYYKPYSENEMKYLPLNTALYNPPKQLANKLANPNELISEEENSGEDTEEKNGSDSDSDEESSSESDDSSMQQEDGTNTAEEMQVDKPQELVEAKCRICNLGIDETVKVTEDLVQCSECKQNGHPSCLDLTMEMVAVIKTYPWQCMECKTCVECMDPYDEDKMMFCDKCDRGYHTFCVGLRSIPTGRWKCRSCKAPDTPRTPKTGTKTRGRGRKRGSSTPVIDS